MLKFSMRFALQVPFARHKLPLKKKVMPGNYTVSFCFST